MGEQIEATILFSDIRDFTAYTLREGDERAFDLLQLHNRIAAAHIRAHEGEVVKTYGDGMMVRFSSAIQAVTAAIAIQRDFNAHTQEHPQEPLLVGMGLHCGRVIQEGGDLFGHAVNLAKRLSDEARSGQILASKAVIEALLLDSPEDLQARWLDLGEREIKGIGPEKLYEIVWRAEVARLTTKDDHFSLILTENDKLVIELGKQVQLELERVAEKFREESEKHAGPVRWLLRKLERWVPQFIDWALLRAGIGVEHDLAQVQISLKGGDLYVQIGKGHPFKIQGENLNSSQVQEFIQLAQAQKDRLGAFQKGGRV